MTFSKFILSNNPTNTSTSAQPGILFRAIHTLVRVFTPASKPGMNYARLYRFTRPRLVLALSFIPAALWLFLFSWGVSLIPNAVKPPINVTLLPTLDHFFFSSASWFTEKNSHSSLDLLAAVPYLLHPTIPFAYIISSAFFPPLRPTLPHFVFSFGVMNLAAVITHLVFPTAPPWYFLKYGMEPANYAMTGDPAALARIDERFHIQLFYHMYADGGKVVFGAWPSLHAAWPYLITRLRPPFPAFVRWVVWSWVPLVWWAAIYLHHHFALDILGGVLFAEFALFLHRVCFRRFRLPQRLLPSHVSPDSPEDNTDADQIPFYKD